MRYFYRLLILTTTIVLLTSPSIFVIGDQKIPDLCGRDISKQIDLTPVAIQIDLTGERPKKVGDEGAVKITLTPNVDIKELVFSISFAGGGKGEIPQGFKPAEPIQPYIKNLKPSNHFQRKLYDLKTNEPKTFSVKFKLTERGYGYIMGSGQSTDEKGKMLFSESSILFFFASEKESYFSYHSILDLDVQKLRNELTRKGLSKEEIEKQIKKLKRSGAKVEKHKPSAKDKEAQKSNNSVTVEGQMQFTDINGNTHPVRFATVQIWDEEAGADDLLATTTTDADGNYSAVVDGVDDDSTGQDIYVVLRAEGDTVVVEDYGTDYWVATGDIWEIDSGDPEIDVPDHTTLTIDITATNDDTSPQNVAFEAYEAVNYLSRYLTNLGEPLPALITVRYPRPSTDSSNYNNANRWMRLSGTDVHDWDNIHHEYGHHIQNLYGTADNPGGTHYLNHNLCDDMGRDDAIRMSWAEGWPTFFGTMVQNELNLSTLTIPNVGDVNYTDTKPTGSDTDYDLETYNAWSMGEGNEISVQRVLWDLYDDVDDAGDTGVSLTAQELWDVITDNQPHTFSAFWNYLTAIHTIAEKLAFSAICAQHNIASEVTGPADGTTFSGGALPTFTWDGNMECDTGGNANYSIRFYNDALTALIWTSPWQTSTSLTPTDAQRDLIFVGPDGTIRWTVSSKDESTPETGVYYGNSRTIIDDFDVPDRNPVDIILALDLSDSMNGIVPGSDTSLTKIQLLQQAVEIFIRTWAMHAIDGDRIGVVYFKSNTSSTPGTPPILMDVAAHFGDIVDDVNSKTAGGCTAIGGSIQVGYDSFDVVDKKKVIILFTDGRQTANPLVDEEGPDNKLKIRVIPAGGTLPFDAHWCSITTATAPDGTTIVPDGDFLYEHDVQIHTIGVGVDGALFEELIERISDDTSALHHFTSAPDEELDIFYTNDLINSLKTDTLEIVKTDNGTIAKGNTKTFSIPINQTAKSLTIVLSWKDELRKDALKLTVKAPDGSVITPTDVSKGDFFNISKFDFPVKSNDREISHQGNWTVRIQSQTEADSVKYQFSAIVDEPCFHFDFNFHRKDYAAGDSIRLTATLFQKGKPLPSVDGIWVNITSPAQSIGNLLSDCLPKVNIKDVQEYRGDETKDIYRQRFSAMRAALLKDRRIANLMRAKATSRVQLFDDGRKEHGDLKAGDGIYSNIVKSTIVPGNYMFNLNILSSSDCGKVARTESTSTLVNIGQFNLQKSLIKAVPLQKDLYAITIRPSDKYGNLLGPGNKNFVKFYITSGEFIKSVVDQFDGSYKQLIKVKPGDNPRITIQIKGKQLINVPLLSIVKKDVKDQKKDIKLKK